MELSGGSFEHSFVPLSHLPVCVWLCVYSAQLNAVPDIPTLQRELKQIRQELLDDEQELAKWRTKLEMVTSQRDKAKVQLSQYVQAVTQKQATVTSFEQRLKVRVLHINMRL